MISREDLDLLHDATVVDESGSKVGKVQQVYLDDQTDQPAWVTVDTGWFGTSQSFVPLEGAGMQDQDLRVGYDKDKIKDAPRVEADGHIEPRQEEELYSYYGLSSGETSREVRGDTGGTGGDDGRGDDQRRGTQSVSGGDDVNVTLSEERLNVDTEQQEVGKARLRKYTTTETENITVPVTKEKLVVEREPADADAVAGEIGDSDAHEEITLREERVKVSKESVPVETVRVGKETVTEQTQVSEQVRKEHVEVDGEGDLGDAAAQDRS